MVLIETQRLQIERLSLPDAAFILALTNTAGWLQYIGDRGVRDLSTAEAYITNGPLASYDQFGHGLYRVSGKEDGLPMGICGLLKRPHFDYPDIGFAFLPEYTGYGYAQEAAAAILGFEQQTLSLSCVWAITLPENARSIRLLEKLGMVFRRMISEAPGKPVLMLFEKKYPVSVT